jgi:hypothetical protein
MRFSWLLISVGWLQGCTYISPDYEEELLGNLDEDGDGCPKKGEFRDCDDNNPHVCIKFVEIPYDGIDNDCSSNLGLLDQVDVDGDGVPGIDYAEWLANGADPGAWPSEANKTEGLVDCRDVTPDDIENYEWKTIDGDEYTPLSHLEATSINPLSVDTIYDGIDSNCDQSNDFDNDEDNFIPPENDLVEGSTTLTYGEAFEAYVAEWGYTYADVSYGDCLDVDEEVHPLPNAIPNAWYDGADQHCTGENDFDQDGDGYTPEVDASGNALASVYANFLAVYHGGVEPASWGTVNPGGQQDCNDLMASVYPGANDTWHDGVDSDCAQDNDFDRDSDGVIDQLTATDWCSSPSEYVDYYNSWSFQGGTATGVPGYDTVTITNGTAPSFSGTTFTCDPDSPQSDFDCEPKKSAFYPGAIEVLGDKFDGDCDGDQDRTPLYGDPGTVDTWTSPGKVVLGKNDEHYLLSTTASSIKYTGSSQTKNNVGVTLYFEHDAGFSAPVVGQLSRDNGRCSNLISAGIDVATTNDGFFVTNGCHDGSKAWLVLDKYTWSTNSYTPSLEEEVKGTNVTTTYSDFDIEINNAGDSWYAWAAGDPGLTFATGDFSSNAFDTTDETNTDPIAFMDLNQQLGLSCSASECTPFDLNLADASFAASSDISWLNYAPVDVSHHHDPITIANADDGLDIVDSGATETIFEGDTVLAADAIYVGNNLYAAAVIGNDVWIGWEISGGDFETANLGNGDYPDFEVDAPTDVALYADNDRLVVAAVNDNDVRWAFFELP